MNYAIILSGGIGTRMRRPDCPKQYIDVGGRPLIMYTVVKFQNNPDVDRIVIVAADEWRPSIEKWLEAEGIKAVTIDANAQFMKRYVLWSVQS